MNEFYVVARTPSRGLRRRRSNSLYAQRKAYRSWERIETAVAKVRNQG